MATEPDTEANASGVVRKLALPAAISAAAGAAGLLMTKRQAVRDAVPKLREAASGLPRPSVPGGGVGEIADDLRGKLDDVLGKDSPPGDANGGTDRSSAAPAFDQSELEERRRAREQRRNERRRGSRS